MVSYPTPAEPVQRLPQGLRILVVDDDPDGRIALGMLLAQAGVDVALAASVREARRSIERREPDAVLSDLMMPDEDGFALIETLRARESEKGRHIPALAISALSDPEIQRRAAEEGFDAYFVKPCDFHEVFGTLARLANSGSRVRGASRVG